MQQRIPKHLLYNEIWFLRVLKQSGQNYKQKGEDTVMLSNNLPFNENILGWEVAWFDTISSLIKKLYNHLTCANLKQSCSRKYSPKKIGSRENNSVSLRESPPPNLFCQHDWKGTQLLNGHLLQFGRAMEIKPRSKTQISMLIAISFH